MTTAQLLPPPLYKVELVEKNRGHFYRVDGRDTLLPGTTGIMRKVIAKEGLYGWYSGLAAETAARLAKEEVRRAIAAGKWERSLDDACKAWEEEGSGAPNARRDKAGDVGTWIHGDIEAFLKTGAMPERVRTDDDWKALTNFMDFWKSSGYTLIAAEVCVAVRPPEWCGDLQDPGCLPYGGKFDVLVADSQERIFLADVKTGSLVNHKVGRPYPDIWIQEGSYAVALEATYPGIKLAGLLGFHVRPNVPPDKVLHVCEDPERAKAAWIRTRALHDDLVFLGG